MTEMSGDFARRWMTTFFTNFHAEKDRLGDLDRQAGDGDFAVNLGQALRRTQANLAELQGDGVRADQVFGAASNAFLHTGGTSGPLLGMWLRDLSKACSAQPEPVAALAAGVVAGTATVQRLGAAKLGDKTMVDAMVPAGLVLEQAHRDGVDLCSALDQAAAAADSGAMGTAGLTASMGRASYVGEAAVGVVDPGAAAIALFFLSGAQAARS